MSIEGWPTHGNRRNALVGVLLLSLVWVADAGAATPYDAGKIRIGLGGGGSLGSDYLIIGASFGYFFLDGLEVGVGGNYWFGASPTVAELSPGLRFVFYFVPALQPYVGAFFRHRFIGGHADQDSVGGEGGVLYAMTSGYVGGGLVYERLVSHCDDDCDAVYPELVFALSF